MTTQPNPQYDYDAVDPEASDAPVIAYPLAQWINGQAALKALKNVAYSGGLFIAVRYMHDGLKLPGWEAVELTFKNGKSEKGLATAEAVIAPIRARFRWSQKRNGVTVHLPRAAYEAGVGMKGNLQVLCAVKGGDDPIALTFTGKASQFFETALKDFQSKVVTPANRNAPKGKPLPRYAFWMTLAPGAHQKASAEYESVITPPLAAQSVPDEPDEAYLAGRYVGRENLIKFQEWYREAEAWATAWDKPGTTLISENGYGDDEPPAPEDEMPW